MITAVKNQSVPPPRTDDSTYDYDSYNGNVGGFDGYDSFVNDGEGGDEGVRQQPSTAGELKARIADLLSQLESSALPKGEMNKIREALASLEGDIGSAQVLHSKNLAQFLAPIEAKLGNYEAKILGLDGADLPGGWGDDLEDKKVTADDINTLIKRIEAGKQEPSEGSGATKDDVLKVLREAMEDLGAGRQAAADAGYQKVLGAVGGLKDDKTIAEGDYGAKPDKIEGNKFTYDGKEDKSFTFKSPGDGKEIEVKSAEKIEIKPPKDAHVLVFDKGDSYRIEVKTDKGTDIFTLPHDADIRIFSDSVGGFDVENSDGHIVVGASSKTEQKFMGIISRRNRAAKLENATIGNNDQSTYGTRDETEMKNAREILGKISEAMREPDPVQRKELWEEATDAMSRLKSTETRGEGYWNNTAQLVFNVMQGEFGETGLKEMLKDGTINSDFASSLASVLTSKTDENDKVDGEIKGWQRGGLDWSHGYSAEWLKKHSTTGSMDD